MNLGHNCIGMSRLWSLLLPTSVYNIFVRIYWTLEKLCNFPNFGVADYIAFLRDLQHKISQCLRWRTCCSDEFGAQLYWHESSMKLTTAYKCLQHICKDLLNFGKIMQFSKFWGGWLYSFYLRICNIKSQNVCDGELVAPMNLGHNCIGHESVKLTTKPTDAFAAAYYCLQVSTTYL